MSPVHGWEDNYSNMSVLLKVIYRFNAIYIKSTLAYFHQDRKSVLKFIWNLKGNLTVKTSFKKNKDQARWLTSKIPATEGGGDREDQGVRTAQEKVSETPSQSIIQV
jgi:hypothetical protein